LQDKKEIIKANYDECIYPPIETTYPKFAILRRNEWIIEKSDFIIFYVSRTFGGAYKAMKYAIKLNKKFINLYDF
jgi:hypothetical protein